MRIVLYLEGGGYEDSSILKGERPTDRERYEDRILERERQRDRDRYEAILAQGESLAQGLSYIGGCRAPSLLPYAGGAAGRAPRLHLLNLGDAGAQGFAKVYDKGCT